MLTSHQDNTLCGARNLGQLAGTRSLNGFIGKQDQVDCYKFSLADERLLSLSVGRLRASASVKLYDHKGKTIGRAIPSCISAEAIETTLEAGRYYLSIKRRKRDTNYRLTTAVSELGTLPISTKLEDLGQLAAGNTTKGGSVSSSNSMDYYQFTLAQNSDFTANVGTLSQPVRLSLYYDRNNNKLPDSDELFTAVDSSNTSNASFTRFLPGGRYLLGITALSNSSRGTEYTLTLTQHPQLDSLTTDPGEDSNQAYDLGELVTSVTAKQLVGSLDSGDVYKFNLKQTSSFNANLSNLSRTTALKLFFDRNGNGLADNDEEVISSSGAKTTSLSSDLPAGTYFISVTDADSTSGNTFYSLGLFATAQPGNLATDPGNSSSEAYDFGELSSAKFAQDLIGKLDETDFYKFSLSQISGFSASLSNLKRATTMTLYFDRNNNNLADSNEVVTSAYSWGDTANLLLDLPAGSYFLSVNDAEGYHGGNTRYNLALAQTPKPSNLSTDPPSDSNSAYTLGTLSGTVTAQDYIGPLDNRDFYRFDLNQTHAFTATLNNSPSGSELYLYADTNNNGFADTSELVSYASWYYPYYGSGSPTISTSLNAGTYFLLVNASGSPTGSAYNLILA